MSRIFRIDELIGKTPLVKPRYFAGEFEVDLIFKMESFNPMHSIKDRIALSMLDDALKRKKIREGTVVIEPTSGNTGIGLAFICAVRRIPLILTMPSSMSEERRRILKALGARLVLTDAEKGMNGAIEKAEELHRSIPDSIVLMQFSNAANPEIHYRTTGPEIFEDTDGGVDVVIAGVGTGGTITGVSRYLKERIPPLLSIAVEPENSPVLSGGKPGLHKIMGIGAGFIPEILDMNLIDEVITVTDEEAYKVARKLAKEEGLMVGISSGAVASAALKIARRKEMAGKTMVAILPDHGERYLSTDLFKFEEE